MDDLGPGTIEWLGTRYRTTLPKDASGSSLSIVDSISPEGSGPPRHVHDDADEAFVVLTGEVAFWIDGEVVLRGPGESAFVPRGTNHTFHVTKGPSRHLIILTPGGFEGFFHEMAEGAFVIPQDMDTITGIAARHNLRFTGPPLEPSEVAQ